MGFHTDDRVTDSRYLLRSAAIAIRYGLPRERALFALTLVFLLYPTRPGRPAWRTLDLALLALGFLGLEWARRRGGHLRDVAAAAGLLSAITVLLYTPLSLGTGVGRRSQHRSRSRGSPAAAPSRRW